MGPAGPARPGGEAEGGGSPHSAGSVIRPAVQGEAEALRDVVHAAYAHYVPRIGKPPGPMLDDYALRIANGQAWVLEDAGRIIGVLVLEDQSDSLLLDNIAVRPECQGGGHGRALMAFTEAEARRRGWHQIRLYTHVLMTENQALYRRLGYVETGRVAEKGFDRVYMERNLSHEVGEVDSAEHRG
jgi:ribosomal protein S18 acetylase RimI-like enzyme